MPTIYSTGKSEVLISSELLPGEHPEAERSIVVNAAITSGELIKDTDLEEAIRVFTEPPLKMPFDLANLLVQAAIKLKKVNIDFETTFQHEGITSGPRNYTKFKLRK